MKYIIGLDLSTTCSGYSKFDLKGNLIEYKKITPKTTLTTLEKISHVVYELNDILSAFNEDDEIEKVVIEDIYLGNFRGFNQVRGFATLARLSGAVITTILFVTNKEVEDIIILRNAVSARPMVGLKGNCQKVEVQVWVLKNFTDIDTSEYEALIEAVQAKKEVKDIDQKEYKKRMLKISKLVEEETGFGEDISDAILLGYGESSKGIKK
ncbi:MAG: hypothetical protein M0R03_23750 [Novosphingobium sp.]|nr:hypothetical protein [Novosphingobium sp.]